MELVFYKSESTIQPILLDTESSPTTIFIRKNVEETTRTDESGIETVIFVYDEASVPKSVYESYRQDKLQADVEYLYMMGGLDYE